MSCSIECGSPKDTDKRFCFSSNMKKEEVCPLNSFNISYNIGSLPLNQSATLKLLKQGYYANLMRDNTTNNPIVDIRYAMSKPCGNLQ